MNYRLRHLPITALSTAAACLALAGTAAASQTQASVSSVATPGASAYAFGGASKAAPTAHISGRSQASSCGDVDALAGDSSTTSQARATVCLLNRERTSRGLRPLSLNRRLTTAAVAHNRDMVANDYFAHESRNGDSSADRIQGTGYTSGARSWIVGENLAWGSGDRSTPREIVSAWMHSPGHRANILTGRFREIGVGIDFRAPVSSIRGAAVTYTTTFGARS